MRGRNLLPETMLLARELGWGEAEIFAMPLRRRLAYLLQLEKEQDAETLAGLFQGPGE